MRSQNILLVPSSPVDWTTLTLCYMASLNETKITKLQQIETPKSLSNATNTQRTN